MNPFFFEIYSEEMPARMQKRAVEQLKKLLESALEGLKIPYQRVETYVTPHRLVGHVVGIMPTSEPYEERTRGPKMDLHENIIMKFKKQNETLEIVEDEGYFYAVKKFPEQPTETLLPGLIQQVLEKFEWPKRMRWPESTLEWIRPIRSVYCFYQDAPMSFEIPALGLATSQTVRGHRFLSSAHIAPISFDDYKAQLRDHFVILDQEERKAMIREHLTDPVDVALLEENAGLVEYPYVKVGNIDVTDLPKEVLTCVMKHHQKYFLQDPTHFIVVANIDADTVIPGYERVLRARLKDAQFFYQEDLKTPLRDLTERLDRILFYKTIGSIGEKVSRLVQFMSTEEEEEAASLCKSDLATHMVYELPELQGVMGRIYAEKQGHKPHIAKAIEEHYFPIGADEPIPSTALGAKLSFADKLDTLVGLMGTGVKVSSSRDPLGLRRAALGIVRIMEVYDLDLEASIERLQNIFVQTLEKDTSAKVLDFIRGRIKVFYQEEPLIHAVLDQNRPILQALRLLPRLRAFSDSPKGQAFLAQYKRLCHISEKPTKESQSLSVLEHPAEKALITLTNQSKLDFADLPALTPLLSEYFDSVRILEGPKEERMQLFHLVRNKLQQLLALV